MDQFRSNDVLFGRGRGIYDHEGNVTFRELVKKYQVDFEL